MAVEQIRTGTDNFSYIVWCSEKKAAVIIDPGMDIEPQMGFLEEKGLKLAYIISTHHHFDHTGRLGELRELTGALSMCGEKEADHLTPSVDKTLKDGEVLEVGDLHLRTFETPGHTPGSICIVAEEDRALFTGDTLFIGDCGRADLPGGDVKALYDSIQRLKSLPVDLTVFPGHDYGDRPFDLLGRQIRTNRTMLDRDLGSFLKLP